MNRELPTLCSERIVLRALRADDADLHGAGLGPQALRMAASWLIGACGHHRLIIDPASANERAIAVYASIGFRPVGIMRSYERGPDGEWHDGLLMDLLAGALR